MQLSLQKKLFLAFFTTTVILVAFVAGTTHYVMRDGFDDYIAHVKLQRLATVERAVVQYSMQDPSLSVFKTPGVWEGLILAIDEVKREQNADKAKDNKKPNKSQDPPPYVKKGDLPPYARGVALLDTQGAFVAGEHVDPENALHIKIENTTDKIVGYWLIRKGPPESDTLGNLFIAKQLKILLLLLGVAAVLSSILAWLLAIHFKKPMLHLQTAFRQVAQGKLDTRMRLTQTDEVGEIAQHFNAMTSQLEAQEKARNQWVSDTSHELRTPLTILRMRNEVMRDGIIQTVAEEWQRNLNTIADLTNLVDDLQAVSRSGERGWNLQKSSVDLQQWLDEVIQDHLPAFNAQGLNLSLQAKAGVVVSADVQRLTQVVRNVLVNSMRYTDTPGQTIVALSSDKKMARITISDSAPAVPDAALEHLFDRFYRCEGSRNRATGGSGLGLAICESIVKAHQGRIFAMHSEIGGLTIVIELPLLGA